MAAPTFAPVVVPALRESCAAATAESATFLDHAHVRPATEKCEHGLRARRTYQEIADTPSGEILKVPGGPKPWPDLTAKQREIVEGRERERQAEAVTAARFAGEASRTLPRRSL